MRSLPRVRTSLDVLPSEVRETLEVVEVAEAVEAQVVVEAEEFVELTESTDVGRMVRVSGSVLRGARVVPSTTAARRRERRAVWIETMSPSAEMWRRGGRAARNG